MLADKNPDILTKPKDLDYTIKMLKNGIGVQIIQNWGFPRDFEDIINHSENWFLETKGKPNYTDIIKVSKLHSYIGTRHMKNLPPLNEVPSYQKLIVGHLDTTACITLLDSAKAELQQTQNLLN
jgi:HD-like signal output (HDOD) protein